MYSLYYQNSLNSAVQLKLRDMDEIESNELCVAINKVEKWIQLVDMNLMLRDSSEMFLSFNLERMNDFWKINERLINYLGVLYAYKEFIRSYNKSVERIADIYFEENNWYRFACEYRNKVTHQTASIRYFDEKNKKFYINLDELEKNILNDKKNLKKNEKFIGIIDNRKSETCVIGGIHYLEMSFFINNVDVAVNKMSYEIFRDVYKKEISGCIETLRNKIVQDDSGYKLTYLINEDNDDCYSLNREVEMIIVKGIEYLNSDKIVIDALRLLRQNGYTYCFENNSPFEKMGWLVD